MAFSVTCFMPECKQFVRLKNLELIDAQSKYLWLKAPLWVISWNRYTFNVERLINGC